MEFDENWLEHIPGQANLERLMNQPAFEHYQRAEAELESLGNRVNLDALSWVFRLGYETELLNRISSSVPWLDRIAVGFFDPEIDGVAAGFGTIAYSSLDSETTTVETSGLEFLTEDLTVEVDGIAFRTVIRTGRPRRNTSIDHPTNSEVTAWARSARSGQEGWLAPFHAVDLYGTVSYADGGTGRVVENWGECIDAVIATSTNPPQNSTTTTCVRAITPGARVWVTDQTGSAHRHWITDVDVNLGVVRHHLFPIRFSYDWLTSTPGDSGALIVADPCEEPLGMHQGATDVSAPGGTPGRRAYGLCLYQLEDHGGLEVLV